MTTKEIELLDTIISSFGCYSGKVLSRMTHIEKPWIIARGSLQPEDRAIITIDKSIIRQYFDEMVRKHSIINLCDISNYSKAIYKIAVSDNC